MHAGKIDISYQRRWCQPRGTIITPSIALWRVATAAGQRSTLASFVGQPLPLPEIMDLYIEVLDLVQIRLCSINKIPDLSCRLQASNSIETKLRYS